MIRFNCHKCNAAITMNENAAGRRARCRTCGNIIEIPSPSRPSAKVTEMAAKGGAVQASERDHTPGEQNAGVAILGAGLVLGAVSGYALLGCFGIMIGAFTAGVASAAIVGIVFTRGRDRQGLPMQTAICAAVIVTCLALGVPFVHWWHSIWAPSSQKTSSDDERGRVNFVDPTPDADRVIRAGGKDPNGVPLPDRMELQITIERMTAWEKNHKR